MNEAESETWRNPEIYSWLRPRGLASFLEYVLPAPRSFLSPDKPPRSSTTKAPQRSRRIGRRKCPIFAFRSPQKESILEGSMRSYALIKKIVLPSLRVHTSSIFFSLYFSFRTTTVMGQSFWLFLRRVITRDSVYSARLQRGKINSYLETYIGINRITVSLPVPTSFYCLSEGCFSMYTVSVCKHIGSYILEDKKQN